MRLKGFPAFLGAFASVASVAQALEIITVQGLTSVVYGGYMVDHLGCSTTRTT